ncbi:MAG: hypothetical protein Q8L34_01625 [Candidatus Woesearchaeota archaeon]|nr:hypothetical protein [Candidatus Woesearchaeota archaeon]
MSSVQAPSRMTSADKHKERKDRLLEIVNSKGHTKIVDYPLSFGIHRAVGPFEAAIYISPIEKRIVVSDERHFDEATALAQEFEARTQEQYEVCKNYAN